MLIFNINKKRISLYILILLFLVPFHITKVLSINFGTSISDIKMNLVKNDVNLSYIESLRSFSQKKITEPHIESFEVHIKELGVLVSVAYELPENWNKRTYAYLELYGSNGEKIKDFSSSTIIVDPIKKTFIINGALLKNGTIVKALAVNFIVNNKIIAEKKIECDYKLTYEDKIVAIDGPSVYDWITSYIRGVVRDQNNQPIEGAFISIYTDGTLKNKAFKTAVTGEFNFKVVDFARNKYRVMITKNGYKPSKKYFSISELKESLILILEKDSVIDLSQIEMIQIKSDTFEMGVGKYIKEDLLHKVILSDYSIGKYEVTQKLWRSVMGSNPSDFSGCDECPVHSISWNNIQTFLKKLNEKTGKVYKLPTEAQWEYAAQGGEGNKYIDLEKVAWLSGNSNHRWHPVGKLQPNKFGIYDMLGNVIEICSDMYSADYYPECKSHGMVVDPIGPKDGVGHVIRGSSIGNQYASTTRRSSTNKRSGFGFRLCLVNNGSE